MCVRAQAQHRSQGSEEAGRAIERGSCIVTCVMHGMQLVLQMPRGNLETICPRPLVREFCGQSNGCVNEIGRKEEKGVCGHSNEIGRLGGRRVGGLWSKESMNSVACFPLPAILLRM